MTQDEIIEMAKQAGMMSEVLQLGRNLELLTNFAKLVAQHEREACATLCDVQALTVAASAEVCAEAIRARGQA